MEMSSPSLDTKPPAQSTAQPMDAIKIKLQNPITKSPNEPIVEPKKCHTTSYNRSNDERMPFSENGVQKSSNKGLAEAQASLEKLTLFGTAKPLQQNQQSARAQSTSDLEDENKPSISEKKAQSDVTYVEESVTRQTSQLRAGENIVTVEALRKEDPLEILPNGQHSLPTFLDAPDPRLLIALENPRDRLFVLKLEQDVISFIMTPSREFMDSPPINSYHRMLAHKIAEFYRLTHVSSTESVDVVRLYLGHAARIPPVKLVDMKVSNKTPSETPPPGSQLSVKIMRRTLSEKSSEAGSDKPTNPKPSDSQNGDISKPTSREEREAAYQLARARIFGDFKESPPESPSPTKTPQDRPQPKSNREQDDGFQSRSQFVTIPSMYSAFEVQKGQWSPAAPLPPPNTTRQSFNPGTHALNPSANSYIPGRPFQPQPPDRIYPMGIPPRQVATPQLSNSFYLSPAYPPHPPHLPVAPPNLQSSQYHSQNFIPPPAPTQAMGLAPQIYPFNHSPNLAPALTHRNLTMGQTYGPPLRPNIPFNRFTQDQPNMNSYPQTAQPFFGGMGGAWPSHDANTFQNRPIDPSKGSLANTNTGMFGVGSRT